MFFILQDLLFSQEELNPDTSAERKYKNKGQQCAEQKVIVAYQKVAYSKE